VKTRSLRLRLFLAGAAAVTLALTLAGFGLVLLFEHHLERTMDDDIETYVRKIISELTVDLSKGRLRVIRSTPDPRFERLHSGFYWQVATDDESEIERSPSLGDKSLEFPSSCEPDNVIRYYRMIGPRGNPLRGGMGCISLGDAEAPLRVRVLAALGLVAVARARDAFATELVATLLLITLGLAFAMWVQVGLGLAPLARLGAEVGEIARGARRRLGQEGPREVQALVDEVNGLLDERDKEIERARNRAADLAHGLKTPLTALAADARLLRARGEVDIAQSLDRIGDAMHRHVERELARARSIRHARAPESTPVGEVVDALARTLASAGAEAAFDLRIAPGSRIAVERVDLMEILGNLMENAARHAVSRVRISAAGGRFIVEDDGPGLPAESEALIRERGGRLDERGGAGLGLAIVQDVLDAYGATMRFSRSDLGGLCVEADLSRSHVEETRATPIAEK
jgi:signal transduction histidine kinase